MAVGSQILTTEELLAMPDDGITRELIQGELRESDMTTRGRPHCRVEVRLSTHLFNWLVTQPQPRGQIYAGEIRVRLRRDPDTLVGIDLAYVSAAVEEQSGKDSSIVEGPPILAVEILSPSDKAEDIADKIHEYLAAGVPLIWYVDPAVRIVISYRQDGRHELFNEHQELTGGDHLPGFSVPVAEIFAD